MKEIILCGFSRLPRKGSIYFNRQRIKLRRAILRKPTFHITTSPDTSLGGLDVNIALLETMKFVIGPMQLRKMDRILWSPPARH